MDLRGLRGIVRSDLPDPAGRDRLPALRVRERSPARPVPHLRHGRSAGADRRAGRVPAGGRGAQDPERPARARDPQDGGPRRLGGTAEPRRPAAARDGLPLLRATRVPLPGGGLRFRHGHALRPERGADPAPRRDHARPRPGGEASRSDRCDREEPLPGARRHRPVPPDRVRRRPRHHLRDQGRCIGGWRRSSARAAPIRGAAAIASRPRRKE